VAPYLSDEWFEQLSQHLVLGPAPSGVEAPPTLVLQHLVTGCPVPGGEIDYHVRVADHGIAIVRGRATDPDITFSEDYTAAAAIASGELSAPAALLAGRIRIGGDMAALIAHQGVLTRQDPVPAAVRAATTY